MSLGQTRRALSSPQKCKSILLQIWSVLIGNTEEGAGAAPCLSCMSAGDSANTTAYAFSCRNGFVETSPRHLCFILDLSLCRRRWRSSRPSVDRAESRSSRRFTGIDEPISVLRNTNVIIRRFFLSNWNVMTSGRTYACGKRVGVPWSIKHGRQAQAPWLLEQAEKLFLAQFQRCRLLL
jgi:hypothetical protein